MEQSLSPPEFSGLPIQSEWSFLRLSRVHVTHRRRRRRRRRRGALCLSTEDKESEGGGGKLKESLSRTRMSALRLHARSSDERARNGSNIA